MKILVPTDGSKYADEALYTAIDLVKKAKGGELCLISVAPAIAGFELEFSAGSRETIRAGSSRPGRRRSSNRAATSPTRRGRESHLQGGKHSAPSIPDAIVDVRREGRGRPDRDRDPRARPQLPLPDGERGVEGRASRAVFGVCGEEEGVVPLFQGPRRPGSGLIRAGSSGSLSLLDSPSLVPCESADGVPNV